MEIIKSVLIKASFLKIKMTFFHIRFVVYRVVSFLIVSGH